MTKEFKIKKFQDATVYTLESATSGATGSGSISSVSDSIGGVRKRGDNLIAQEGDTVKVPVTQKPRQGPLKPQTGAGAHRDKKKEQKQGKEKHRKPYMEDHEISMASNELKSIYSDAKKLLMLVQRYGEQGDLEAWQQSKITKSADYLNSVLQSIGGDQGVAEGVRDLGYDAQSLIMKLRRDVEEKRLQPTPQAVLAAARELAGDMEFAPQLLVKQVLGQGVAEGDRPFRGVGGAFNRGDDERHDLDPTEWYIVKDGKMFKTSVYPNQVQLAIAQGYSRTRDEAKAKAGEQGVAEGPEFGSNYAEKLAQQVFGENPNLDTTGRANELLNAGFAIAKQELGKRAVGVFRDEDFPSDFVSAYNHLKKQDASKGEEYFEHLDNLLEDWQKVNKRDKTDGMSRKAVKAYRRENPGSKLKTAVTTKPSKLKKGGKASKRRKSFCARMSGNKGPMKKPNGKPTPKALALRRWNCEEDAYMNSLNAQVLEKLDPQAPVDTWVQDFQKADPNKYKQFKNKTPQKKAQMAVAARYAANEPSKKK